MLVFTALAMLSCLAASAQARPRQSSVKVFRLHVRQVAAAEPAGTTASGRFGTVTTNGRLVGIPFADGHEVLLIDQRHRRQTMITTAGQTEPCTTFLPVFAGRWLAGNCASGGNGLVRYFEYLYSIATGTWRSVTMPQGCAALGYYGTSGGSKCSIVAGSDWLSWTEECFGCGSYSGLVALDPSDAPLTHLPQTSPTKVVDLDSRIATTHLCAPLRNTSHNSLILNESAQFVVGYQSAPLNPYAIAQGRHNAIYLERCRTRLHVRLPSPPITGNRTELLFYPGAGRTLTGMFLATRSRFRVELPALVLQRIPGTQWRGVAQLLLSSTTLYVVGLDGTVWSSPAPRPPGRKRT